jgi:hypothetical protein
VELVGDRGDSPELSSRRHVREQPRTEGRLCGTIGGLNSFYPFRSPPPVAPVAQNAGPIPVCDYLKSARASWRFTLAPGYLDVEVAQQLVALDAAQMRQSAEPAEDRHWRAATPAPGACSRFRYQHAALAG